MSGFETAISVLSLLQSVQSARQAGKAAEARARNTAQSMARARQAQALQDNERARKLAAAQAAQRARFGAAGLSGAEGSGAAVLDGLAREAERDRALDRLGAGERLSGMATARQTDLLQASDQRRRGLFSSIKAGLSTGSLLAKTLGR